MGWCVSCGVLMGTQRKAGLGALPRHCNVHPSPAKLQCVKVVRTVSTEDANVIQSNCQKASMNPDCRGAPVGAVCAAPLPPPCI